MKIAGRGMPRAIAALLTSLLLLLMTLVASPAQAIEGVSAADDVFTVDSGEHETVDVGANDTFPADGSVYFELIDGYIDGYIVESPEEPGVLELSTPRTFTGPVDFRYGIFDATGSGDAPLATATLRLSGNPAGQVIAADDTLETFAGVPVEIDLAANDTGAVGTDQYWVEWDPPPTPLGDLWVGSDGRAYFTPGAVPGSDAVRYEVRDQYGETLASASLHLTVTERATSLSDDSFTVEAGEWTKLDLVANDGDVLEGDSIVVTSGPESGGVDYWGTELSYYAPPWFAGTERFQYSLHDQNGTELGVATVTVTVTPAPPLRARDDYEEIERGVETPLYVLENDTHDWGDVPPSLEILSDPVHGTVQVVADDPEHWEPYVVYTPAADYTGPDSFEYRLSDASGNTDTALVSLDVALLGPRWLDVQPTLTGARLSWMNPASPAFVGIVGRYAVAAEPGGYVEAPSSPQEGVPIPGLSGSMNRVTLEGLQTGQEAAVSLWADYGDGQLVGPLSDWFTPTVEPVHNLVAEGTDGSVWLSWRNPPGVDRIRVTYAPDGGTGESTQVDLAAATEETTIDGLDNGTGYEFTVTTHHGERSNDAYAWATPRAQNSAPAAEDDYVELRGAEQVWLYPTDNDTDPDEDYLQVIDVSQPGAGAIELMDGELVYSPPSADSPGVDIQYTVSDGHGGRDTATIHLVRRQAFVGKPDKATVPAGESVVIDVLANDGVDGVRYNALPTDFLDGYSPDLGYAWGTVDEEGRLALEFGAGFTQGVTTVEYYLYDDWGEIIGSSTVEVTVTEPLRLSARDDYTEIRANETTSFDVLANDSFMTGLTMAIEQQPAHGLATVDHSGDRPRVLVQPETGFQGSDSFVYRVTDEEGTTDTAVVTYDVWRTGVSGLTAIGGPGEISLSWTNPPATDLAGIVVRYLPDDEGWIETPADGYGWALAGAPQATTITGLAPGVDYQVAVFAMFDDGDYVAAQEWVRSSVPPVAGLTALAGDGKVTLTWKNTAGVEGIVVRYSTGDEYPWSPDEGTGHPVAGAPETTTISGLANGTPYRISVFAQGGGTTSYPELVTATPRAGTNSKPVAVDDVLRVPVGEGAWFDPTENDSDPNRDQLVLLSWTQAAHGEVACNVEDQNVCTYLPVDGYLGPDAFTYVVGDGRGGRDTGAVTVRVYQPNRMPVALNDAATTPRGRPVVVDVAANDSDPDGNALTYSLKEQAAHGTAVVTRAGVATYTPDPDFVDEDVFRYFADDGRGGTRSATVTVTVLDAPLVSLETSGPAVSVKGKVVLSGRIAPAPLGTQVELQRLAAGTWMTIATTRTTQASAARDVANGAPYSFTRAEATGKYQYRVLVPAAGEMAETRSDQVAVRFYAAGLGRLRTTGNEYVTVKNTGKVALNLKGWTIRNRAGKVLTLGTRSLGAGGWVRVHPGRGRTTATDIYLRRGPTFGDRHDNLTLRDAAKAVVAVKRY